MQVPIRPMQQGDAEAVAALVRAAFAAQPVPLDPPPSALRVTAKEVLAVFAAGGGGAVAAFEGRIAGSLLWQPEQEALHVSRLAVDPAFRRRGIARALLGAAEREAWTRGLRAVTLGTRLALTGNRALFAAAGFREVAEHAHEGYAWPTRVDLRKELAPEPSSGGLRPPISPAVGRGGSTPPLPLREAARRSRAGEGAG